VQSPILSYPPLAKILLPSVEKSPPFRKEDERLLQNSGRGGQFLLSPPPNFPPHRRSGSPPPFFLVKQFWLLPKNKLRRVPPSPEPTDRKDCSLEELGRKTFFLSLPTNAAPFSMKGGPQFANPNGRAEKFSILSSSFRMGRPSHSEQGSSSFSPPPQEKESLWLKSPFESFDGYGKRHVSPPR